MSRENLAFAQSVFSRWNAGERRFPDEEIHPDVVLVSQLLGGVPVHGRDGVRRYLREIDEQFGEWTMAIDDWRDQAGRGDARHDPRRSRHDGRSEPGPRLGQPGERQA